MKPLQSSFPASVSSGTQRGDRVAGPTARIQALDFTKGALVLFMVLYHWLNYYFGSQGSYYRYLRFLTPSFIFITGFLISHVYLSGDRKTDPQVPKRLLQRGLKILVLFVLLNAALALILPGAQLFQNVSGRDILTIYVTGNPFVGGHEKVASFYILVPIGYLLLLSAGLSIASRFFKYIFYVICVCCFIGLFALYLTGRESGNLELIAIGLLGVISGYVPLERASRVINHPYILLFAYVCYLTVITIYDVNYPLQIVGVCLTLMAIYLVGATEREPGRLRKHVILLGKYSLFGYVFQIAILHMLHGGLAHVDLGGAVLYVSFFLAFALTMLSVEGMDRLRTGSKVVNRMYKGVFA
jgi:uncharacterized membrane protein